MPRKIRDEAEIRATADELPLEPPCEALALAKARQKGTVLVYRVGWLRDHLTGIQEKTALVRCTSCGEEYHLEYVSFVSGCSRGYGMKSDPFGFIDPADKEAKGSYDSCICPCCGSGAKAIHIGKIKYTAEIEKSYFMTFHNIRGHLVLLSWALFKECDKDGNIFYTVRRYEGMSVIGGVAVRFTGYKKAMYCGISWSPEWDVRVKFIDNCDEWEADEIMCFDKDAFEATDSAKSALDVFIRDGGNSLRIFAYLQIWARYPQVENLVRSGFSGYLQKLIKAVTSYSGYYVEKRTFYSSKISEYINVKKKKPSEMLGLEKDELHLLNEYPVDTVAFYAFIKNTRKIRLTAEQLTLAGHLGISGLRELFERPVREGFSPPVVRTLNYLNKVTSTKKNKGVFVTPSYLRDYWSMVSQIQNALPPELLFPKDIVAAHDAAMLRIKEKTDEAINSAIAEFAHELEWMSFRDEETGVFIRACADQNELIKEGRFLHHCVGTYAKRVAGRETCIMFIRRIEKPCEPFYTLEYQNGVVVQNRGKNNCSRTKEVQTFENKWLDYIKNYKENMKHGKCSNRNKEGLRTGA